MDRPSACNCYYIITGNLLICIYYTTAEPHPPSNLVIEVDGPNLVATWTEPFSLEREEISYVVTVTNKDIGATAVKITINVTTYIFMKPFDAHNCEEYLFTVFSRNDFSESITAVKKTARILTGKSECN